MLSCREHDTVKLIEIVEAGLETIGAVAREMGRGVAYVHSLARESDRIEILDIRRHARPVVSQLRLRLRPERKRSGKYQSAF